MEIRDKEMMHEALVRHGLFLPDTNASICTESFLEGVAQKKVWCPLVFRDKIKAIPTSSYKRITVEDALDNT